MSIYTYDNLTIVGKVGKNADMKFMNDGRAVTSFSVAVDRSYKPKDGDLVKRTIWYRVHVYGNFAEVCKDIKKGDTVAVIGKLEADWNTGAPKIWSGKDGTAGTSFDMTANEVKFLSSKQGRNTASTSTDETQDNEDLPF